jgi:hypothetical protein
MPDHAQEIQAMSFVITGLAPDQFSHLFGLPDDMLREQNIVRRTADAKPGYPCRITLEDAEPGETLLLLNYESHGAATPYATRYAIYVREGAKAPRSFKDELPPVFANRPIALRLFDAGGMLVGADTGRKDRAGLCPAGSGLHPCAQCHAWVLRRGDSPE